MSSAERSPAVESKQTVEAFRRGQADRIRVVTFDADPEEVVVLDRPGGLEELARRVRLEVFRADRAPRPQGPGDDLPTAA